ncbi:MAG: hypothetical protein AB1410_00315 [Acidobacteriota bacterium]
MKKESKLMNLIDNIIHLQENPYDISSLLLSYLQIGIKETKSSSGSVFLFKRKGSAPLKVDTKLRHIFNI